MALRIVTSRLARATAQAAPGFYAGAARHMSQETDIVKDVFVEQQKKFRALLDATKDLEIPTSGDKAAGSEAASTISTPTSSTATSSGASEEMYRSFNLSYARGELSRHGDVRGGCGISVSDLSSASRAILTMAYAADFARLGYDPLDLRTCSHL